LPILQTKVDPRWWRKDLPVKDRFVVDNVSKRFGALNVLTDVNLNVSRGEILGIAGPNGAGKSTLLNVCTGLLRPDHGEITFAGRCLKRAPQHRLCHLGIARTFQIPQVFESLSVFENVETGVLFGKRKRPTDEIRRARVREILDLLGIADKKDACAASVDLLTRKMIMLGAALATSPQIIFMDEPFGGLNKREIDTYVALIDKIKIALALGFVIVEHKIRALSQLSDRILILNFGSVLCCDFPDQVLRDKRVIDVYLGGAVYA
jgi:branched-chain amino acid transport system ATP-binding protein